MREPQKLPRETVTRTIMRHSAVDIKVVHSRAPLSLRSTPEASLPLWRPLTIVTSRKIGNAPQRNKVRRQIRAIFYENKLSRPDFGWVIITKPLVRTLAFQELMTLIRQHVTTYYQEQEARWSTEHSASGAAGSSTPTEQ